MLNKIIMSNNKNHTKETILPTALNAVGRIGTRLQFSQRAREPASKTRLIVRFYGE